MKRRNVALRAFTGAPPRCFARSDPFWRANSHAESREPRVGVPRKYRTRVYDLAEEKKESEEIRR